MLKNNFIRDIILLFLLVFALTSLYDKVKLIFDRSIEGWNIYWDVLGQTIVEIFKGYPLVMITTIAVVLVALFFIWLDRKKSKNDEEITTILRDIKKSLEEIKEAFKNERNQL